MPANKRRWVDDVQVRLAVKRDRLKRLRWPATSAKRAMTLILGTALSIGGVGEAFDGAKFLVQKDLDRVQVVRESAQGNRVVADMQGKFIANSVYKVARVVPDRFVRQQLNLFDPSWLGFGSERVEEAGQRLTFVTNAVREEFFKTLPFGSIIHEKAAKYDVDPSLVAAVIEQESRFKQRARSHRGAMGLMQLMPRTGRWMGARNLYDPEQNVDAGVKYLKYLDKRFNGNQNKIIAAYNAGEGNVMKYGGTPPFRETRTYLKKVLGNYDRRQKELAEFEQNHRSEDEDLGLGR